MVASPRVAGRLTPPLAHGLFAAVRHPLSRGKLVVPLILGLTGLAVAAVTDDRQAAESALAALSATPSAATIAERPISAARDALRRAEDARAADDPEHSARLEALAREWAITGTDLAQAVAVEARADALEARAAELEGKIRRARALLEQTVARRGRAQSRLQELEAPPAGSAAHPAPGGAP